MTFLLAGHETSANFLSFTLYLIAANPSVQERIQRELASPKFPLKYNDLQQLELIGNVIKVSIEVSFVLRPGPNIYFLIRKVFGCILPHL